MTEQGMIGGRRLRLEDVNRRTGDLARVERLLEGGLVDQAAAGAVDEPYRRFHQCQLAGADEVARLGRQRRVQRDEVATAPEIVEPRDALTPCSSALSAARNGSKPTTVKPKACARFATARPTRPRPITPSVLPSSCVPVNLVRSHLPAFRLSLALATFRASASKQSHGMLGRRNRVAPWRVHHDDAAARRRCDVDVVDAHAGAHDRLEPRLAFQDLSRQLGARSDDDSVGFGECLAQQCGILGQLGIDHDLDPRLLARAGQAPLQPICQSPARDASRSKAPCGHSDSGKNQTPLSMASMSRNHVSISRPRPGSSGQSALAGPRSRLGPARSRTPRRPGPFPVPPACRSHRSHRYSPCGRSG